MADKVLTMDSINPNIVKMEYAVRGPIVARATELEKELANGANKPFTSVMKANIGDCHATGQTPITFIRQVLSVCAYPEMLETCNFPQDVKDRAKRLLGGCKGGSIGSYSASPGIDVIREDIAKYISERDGLPSKPEDIMLCTGASDGIKQF